MGRTVAKQLTDKSIQVALRSSKRDGREAWLSGGNGFMVKALASGRGTFYRRYISPTTSKRSYFYLGDYDPEGKAGLTLSEAGIRNAEITKLINADIDPSEHTDQLRKQAETARQSQEAAERQALMVITVGGLFEQWFKNRIQPEFKKPEWIRRDVMGSVLSYEFKPDGRTAIRLEDMPVNMVTRSHIVEVVEATQQRGANALANDQLRYLERMFEYAMTKEHLDVSPFVKIEKRVIRKREQSRTRALTRDELRTVLRALDGMRASWQVQGIIAITICTGQRSGYVCQMEWTEIVNGEWRIPPDKQLKEQQRKTTPQTHVVYLPTQAIELLEKCRPITGEGRYVFKSNRIKEGTDEFPITQASVEQSIGRHLRAMPGQGHRSDKKTAEDIKPYWDMPHFNAHDLRRTVATRMADDVSIQPHIVEKILNHAPSNELAAIYNRATYEKERRDAAVNWGNYLTGLVSDNVLIGNFGALPKAA